MLCLFEQQGITISCQVCHRIIEVVLAHPLSLSPPQRVLVNQGISAVCRKQVLKDLSDMGTCNSFRCAQVINNLPVSSVGTFR